MTEQTRKEFESAVLRDWPQAQLRRCDSVSSRAGQYADERIQHAWWGWQASRAAIEVELPTVCASDDPFELKRDIEYELELVGVRVKP